MFYFFAIQFLLLQGLMAPSASAGVADIYTSASKSLYELVQNKKCGDFVQADFSGGVCKATSQNNLESMNDIVENAFFKTAAEEEVRNLGCEIAKIEVIRKDPEIVKKIKEDFVRKLPHLKALYEGLLQAKFDYLHKQTQANQMRSYAHSSKEAQLRYSTFLNESAQKEKEAEQLHAAFEASVQSLWMGNSQTVRSFLADLLKSDSLKDGEIPKNFETKFQSLFLETSGELTKNRQEIENQDFTNLDLKTRTKLAQNSYYAEVFSEKTGIVKASAVKLQCRLDAKYIKGNEYLDNTAMMASFVLSGGGALLSKAPGVLVATLSQATRSGKIAFNSSRVLLASGAGLSSHLMLEDFDRTCRSSVKALTRKNLCTTDPQQISSEEMNNLNEGNCALSLVLAGLPLAPGAVGLKNIYKNPLNLTRAPLKPKVIGIDDVEEIKKLDPYQNFDFREDLRQIRANSGRLGDKYVSELPELKGSLREAFDGPIEQQKFKTGQVVWQIQRSNQTNSGNWFSTSVAKSREEAEEMFYVEKWGNDRGQMRMYIVKDDFTAYTGKVAGGSGDQLFVPYTTPVNEVLEPLSLRSIPGGKVYDDLSKIEKGKVIEISTKSNDGSLLIQGEFVGFKKGNGKYDTVTVRDPNSNSLRSHPFEVSDDLVVRDISEKGIIQPTVYSARTPSRELRQDGPVELTRVYKDESGNYVQTTYRGLYERTDRSSGITVELADGKKVSFPRSELHRQYSYNLTPEEFSRPTTPLKKDEKYLANLIPGDKIRLKAHERAPQGQTVIREFTGEYQGVDGSYVVLKRPGDVAPIYVSQFDIPQQKVTQVKGAKSSLIPTDTAKRKWLPETSLVEVKYVDDSGRPQTAVGRIMQSYQPEKAPETIIEVNGKWVAIPNSKISRDGLKLLRGQTGP